MTCTYADSTGEMLALNVNSTGEMLALTQAVYIRHAGTYANSTGEMLALMLTVQA